MATTTPSGSPPPTRAAPGRPDSAARVPGAGTPPDAETPPDAAAGTAAGLPQLLTVLKSVIAPTTVLTGLLFYFGWMHAYRFFRYFGINSTLLGLTTQDYLMRSVDGMFVPLTVLGVLGLVALALHAWLVRTAPDGVLTVLLPVVAGVGLALTVLGLSQVFIRPRLPLHPVVPSLSLAAGVLLLTYAAHLLRLQPGTVGRPPAVLVSDRSATARWALIFVLVSLALFWAASDYAALVGTSRAQQQRADMQNEPGTVVYSAQSLSLGAPGVREVACRNPDAAYRYRYDGLKLIMQSGDQYVLLPQAWTPEDGVALLLPRSDALRLEFVPAGKAPPPTC